MIYIYIFFVRTSSLTWSCSDHQPKVLVPPYSALLRLVSGVSCAVHPVILTFLSTLSFHLNFDLRLHHVSPRITMYHHVSPCITMYHHVSPCITMYHHVSSCITMYHHVSPCITMYHHVSLTICCFVFVLYYCTSYISLLHDCYLKVFFYDHFFSRSLHLTFYPRLLIPPLQPFWGLPGFRFPCVFECKGCLVTVLVF